MNRTEKPRTIGLTIAIDRGLSLRAVEDVLSVSQQHLDMVKLGWGTSLVTPNIAQKIDLYQEAGIPVFFGGTLFEYFLINNQLDTFRELIDAHKVEIVEISDGSIEIPHEEKIQHIYEFSKNYRVLSEVGNKDISKYLPPHKWIQYMKEELENGAEYVIAESRESGRGGICHPTGELKIGLMEDFVVSLPVERIIFEAPNTNLQVWFVKRFGENVNLGNIAVDDIIPLETLRRGLRGDTILHFHKREGKKMLGELLIENGAITKDQLENSLRAQAESRSKS